VRRREQANVLIEAHSVITNGKRADVQKGAIGKILFGAATGGRADG